MNHKLPLLLLLHQIPPKPAYFRAKVLRRLEQVGALPIKNSAYLLPLNQDTMEDFQWIRQEIADQGGTAWVFQTDLPAGMSQEEIESAFQRLQAAKQEALIEQCRSLLRHPETAPDQLKAAHRKLVKQHRDVLRLDFFPGPRSKQLETLMGEVEGMMREMGPASPSAAQGVRGRTWVTRRDVHIDRIASAWLIRRFIDPEAIIRFVDPQTYQHTEGETRFDMFGGEYTHRGSSCTFEVLVASFELTEDRALVAIGEIVHDIDLKDGAFRREEAPGVARLIDGVCAHTTDDEVRLQIGRALFDSLHAGF